MKKPAPLAVPKMMGVDSSNVQSVGFSNDGLWVRFKGGALYQYKDAPKAVYDKLLKSESPGSVFRTEVRGKFTHEQHHA